jgi:CDP-glycerol glycerophosphotransferase (TagB/SpsB family)
MLGVKVKRLTSYIKLPGYALLCIFAWIFIVPIALLVPRNKNWVAVIGRQEGKFLDNAKYFFIQANQDYPNKRFVFISENESVVELINNHGFDAKIFPSLGSLYFLLRCSWIVADEPAWHEKFKVFLLWGAKTVQIWHGVWCKYIELSKWQHEHGKISWSSSKFLIKSRLFLYRLTGRRMTYDVVVATSEFYRKEVFQPAFLAKEFLITGYPRNSFALSLTGEYKKLAWSNIDTDILHKLTDWESKNKTLVLIAPTFRDSGTMPMQLTRQDFLFLDRFAVENNFEFIFKLHPFDINNDFLESNHFHIYQRDADIYPLFPYFDALISDYSSITMDFLLCDRPILFFIPENDTYLERDRQLQFNPKTMMPGVIANDIKELTNALLIETNKDHFENNRQLLRKKVFDNIPQDEAIHNIIKCIDKMS